MSFPSKMRGRKRVPLRVVGGNNTHRFKAGLIPKFLPFDLPKVVQGGVFLEPFE